MSYPVAKSVSMVAPKVAAQLARVGRVLSGALGKVTLQTRQKIVELFETIRGTFDQQAKSGPLTRGSAVQLNKFLEGIALPPNVMKQLEARLTRFNPAGLARIPIAPTAVAAGAAAGGQPVVVNSTITLDGQKVGQNTKRFLLNDRRFNPPSRR